MEHIRAQECGKSLFCSLSLLTLCKGNTDSFGGDVWAMAVNQTNTTLAAGCESGVRLFTIEDDKLVYTRSLMSPGITTALSFHKDGEALFTCDSKRYITKWDVKGAKVDIQMRLEKQGNKVVAITSMAAFDNMTVAVGTTIGRIHVFDCKIGTQVQVLQEQETPLLALVSNPAQNLLFASGVDPRVCMYRLVDGKWVYSSNRRRHTHDITSLVHSGTTLIAGGRDTQLSVYTDKEFTKTATPVLKHELLVQPYPTYPLVSLAPSAHTLLCRIDTGLSLWRLGSAIASTAATANFPNGHQLPVGEAPVKLLDLWANKVHNYFYCGDINM